MATVDKAFAERIRLGNGWLPEVGSDNPLGDNPRCIRIVKYNNAWGAEAYGLTFEHERAKDKYLQPSNFIRNPRIWWQPPHPDDEFHWPDGTWTTRTEWEAGDYSHMSDDFEVIYA